ncbi:MAG TPA: sulfur transferase domain-containing protein [Thermomonas sp.]|nr:sulfur transferase domain-containing protein [Thermomonas sp.]
MHKAFAIVLVLACAVGPLAGCQTHSAAPAPAAMPATSIELRAPRPGLYTAGQPAAADWASIAARGVGTVIDLRVPGELQGRDEAAEVRSAGMRYVAIPVAGASGVNDDNAKALRAALAAAKGPVLVHCASGNRAGGLLALMQARSAAMTTAQALEFGRSAGMTGTEARVRELLDAGE